MVVETTTMTNLVADISLVISTTEQNQPCFTKSEIFPITLTSCCNFGQTSLLSSVAIGRHLNHQIDQDKLASIMVCWFSYISHRLINPLRLSDAYIYASLNWVIIGSDNGLSPVLGQAIIWTIAGILLIGPLGTNFSEILIGIQTFSFKKLHLKTLSTKWRLFCLGPNELNE